MNDTSTYPVTLSIDYPEKLDRFTTFFRLIIAIPILIILGLISGERGTHGLHTNWSLVYGAGGILWIAVLLMILFKQKYPRWWFDWNIALTKFSTRVIAYLLFLRDEYPSTDEEQAVHIDIPYPDVKNDLNRWLPLVKWFLAIPHYIVLAFVFIAGIVVWIIAWFAIVFTASYPKGLFDFMVGIMRWSLRVEAYAFLLTTDKYPPFRFK